MTEDEAARFIAWWLDRPKAGRHARLLIATRRATREGLAALAAAQAAMRGKATAAIAPSVPRGMEPSSKPVPG